MNAMIMSALAAVGIAGFFSATPSDPKNTKDGCCSKPTEDHCGKEKMPDPCCETKTATCCEKKEDCCSSNTNDGKQGPQPNHCLKKEKSKAPGTDVEGAKAARKDEHHHPRMRCGEKAGEGAGCMK